MEENDKKQKSWFVEEFKKLPAWLKILIIVIIAYFCITSGLFGFILIIFALFLITPIFCPPKDKKE